MELFKRAADYIFLTRPVLFVPGLAFLFLGYLRGSGLPEVGFTFLLPGKLWLTAGSYTLLMGAVYIVNQLYDRETDRANEKLFILHKGMVSTRGAVVFALLLGLCSLALGFIVGATYLLLWAVSVVLGLLYSAKPFWLKGRPFLDLLSNAVGYGFVAFAVGYTSVQPPGAGALLYGLPYVLAVGAIFLNTTIPDIPGDRAAGAITTGVFLGRLRLSVLSALVLTLAIAAALLRTDPFVLIAAVAILPVFILTIFEKEGTRFALLSFRGGSLLFVALAALRFPPFAAVCLIIYAALKVYYRLRFGLNYPSLTSR